VELFQERQTRLEQSQDACFIDIVAAKVYLLTFWKQPPCGRVSYQPQYALCVNINGWG